MKAGVEISRLRWAVVGLAMVCVASLGMTSRARGDSFFDDFEDGDARDGNPVTWAESGCCPGNFFVEDGDLVVEDDVRDNTVTGVFADRRCEGDITMRTQTRFDGRVGIFAHSGGVGSTTLYYGVLRETGELLLSRFDDPDFTRTRLGSVFLPEPDPAVDYILQLDSRGETVAFSAWRAGEPRPKPQIVTVDNKYRSGTTGVTFFNGADPNAVGIFRDFFVGDPGNCSFGLSAARMNQDEVKLSWINGAEAPASVDIFRDGELIADGAPADPPEYEDAPATHGLHTYRLEFNVADEECFDLTARVDNTPDCDTHCRGVTVEQINAPDANVRVTVDATDGTGDKINYSLLARQGISTRTAGPQPENVFELDLEPGEWDFAVTVNDDSVCAAPAPDVTCRTKFTVTETILGVQRPGDCNQDGASDISDPICLLNHLFGGDPVVLACPAGMDCNGDGGIDISDAIWALNFRFGGGPPPVLGTDCVGVSDCPDVCSSE